MLNDQALAQAVSQIILRSERQTDIESLERTYVETGVLAQLDNVNSQVLFGRRGTGKSHVLRVLDLHRRRRPASLAVYIDMRLLGSALSMADPSRPMATRCINVFKDLLLVVWETLLEAATDPARNADDAAIAKVEEFLTVVTAVARISQGREASAERTATTAGSTAGSIALEGLTPKGSVTLGANTSNETRVSETYTEVFENNLVFSDLYRSLDAVLEALRIDSLLVLLDEWAAIPLDLQPLLAEFLKRSLMPSARITLKIASLEYRSRLSSPLANNSVVGFEIGGDLSAILDLDDYYVYDRNPEQVAGAFEELLHKHIENELPDDFLVDLGIVSAGQFRQKLFSERDTFVELVRASEGVARDFINIFNAAFFDAKRRGRPTIDVKAVREAARKWYETDKAVNLTPDQHRVLNRIITEVIGNKRARSFLLERDHSRHPMVQSLFDFRVLHLMSKGYSDKENPGVRYNIYTLDYGTYVDLLQTKKQPDLGLYPETEGDAVVPFDDKRSIRRIVVDPAIFDT